MSMNRKTTNKPQEPKAPSPAAVKQEISNLNNNNNNKKRSGNGLENWSVRGGGRYSSTGRTVSDLPSSIYSVHTGSNNELIFQEESLITDELIKEGNTQLRDLLEEIERFFHLEEEFRKYGFIHKRGIMMEGKQGCGKSAIINLACSQAIEEGHIVLICNKAPCFTEQALKQLREVEPERYIICIYEDIESIVKDDDDENRLLSILDGELQLNRILNIATTNYIHKLNPRIVSRPRRFDRHIKIEPPERELREKYFESKYDLSTEEIKEFTDKSDGLTFGSLAELVISIKCYGYNIDNTVENLKKMEEINEQQSMGFGKT